MQFGRMRKAYNRQEDEDEYDEYGYWFHGDLTLSMYLRTVRNFRYFVKPFEVFIDRYLYPEACNKIVRQA